MNKLVNSLLTLAWVEGLNLQTSKQSLIWLRWSVMLCSQWKRLPSPKTEYRRKIEFVGDIYGYEDSVRQVFTILYENAVKYVNEGGK